MSEQSRIETAIGATLDNCELFRAQIAEQARVIASLRQHKNEYMDAAGVTRKALLAEIDALKTKCGAGWKLAADELPQTGVPVIAYYLNSHGMGRRIRAEYIAAWTVQADDVSDHDTECVEYSEQDDAYYIRAGWYELVDNWDDYSRIAVTEGVITRWMLMPASPAHSDDHSEDALKMVKVPRELLEEIVELHRRRGVVLIIHVEQLAELLNGGQK